MIRFYRNSKLWRSVTTLCLLVVASCASQSIDENNPEDLYKAAEQDIGSKKYLQAAERLRIVKNRFPYSHYSTLAALRLADVAFEEESYAEAAANYETFRDLHPRHEKSDYVMFMIGESYYRMLPSSIDRDLSWAYKAIESYAELEKVYPRSSYVETAKTHAIAAQERLAEKELYIGDFYFIRKRYESAARRYEKVASRFTKTSAEETAYSKWAESLKKLNRTDEMKHVWQVYQSRFPNGRYAKKAAQEIQ
jgi:outer membrane protein assembly factor BamD